MILFTIIAHVKPAETTAAWFTLHPMLVRSRERALAGGLGVLAGCSELLSPEPPGLPALTVQPTSGALYALPAVLMAEPRQVELGRDLFAEPALSRDRSLTCATCHPFARGGAAPRATAPPRDKTPTSVNVPSVFNLAYNSAYNWNGRITDLALHALVPLQSPRIMDMSEDAILAALAAEGDYQARFAAAYPDGLTVANVSHALASYQWTLVTPGAPLDRYLLGETEALGPDARAGYELFHELGCVSCHQGTNVGGNLFQRFGVFGGLPSAGQEADLGRYAITKREEDRGVFRVPSLRNVALTAPYFHDGSIADLRGAVRIMGKVQLGRELDAGQVAALVAFLDALTGVLPEEPRG